MDPREERVVEFLARKFRSEQEAVNLWESAGGDSMYVNWNGSPIDNWTAMWVRSRSGMPPTHQELVQKALKRYPGSPELLTFASGVSPQPSQDSSENRPASTQRALIVTALSSETAAVMAFLDHPGKYDTPLYRARKGSYRNWEVVVVTAGQGNEPTAALTQHFMDRFQPECAFFVGVAGGRKDVKHLDVVIGDQVFNVQSGKSGPQGFKPRPESYRANSQFLSVARYVASELHWKDRATDPDVQAHVGHIAVTDGVVSDPDSDLGALMGDNYGHTLAVEMEGFGFQLVAHLNHDVKALVVRGISDLLGDKDPVRDAELQPKAAKNAAAFVFSMLDDLIS